MVAQPKHIYEFGPFRLIPSERQLLRENQSVSLSGKSFDLLVVLVENGGRLVEKEELLKRIWPDSFVEEANLSVNMTALRRALGEGRDDHQFVETVPRHGYRFVAEVKESWENGPTISATRTVAESVEVAEVSAGAGPTRTIVSPRFPALRRWAFVAIGLILLIGTLVALSASGLRGRIFRTAPAIQIQSMAVLPLKNASGGAAQDYFVDGVTEALITDLAKVNGLRVTSRASAMRYKETQDSPAEVGRRLRVDAVVTGSAARIGDRIRVSLQLTHVSTGRELWRAEYDRELREAVALQNQMMRELTQSIGLTLAPAQSGNNDTSINTEAYDNYLRGKFYLYRQTREDNESAIAALQQAVAKDPNFAAAHAELAQAYTWRLFLFAPNEKQLEERAFVEVEKALALDPNSAVAYLARGRLLWTPANHFPHDRAIKEYRHALKLNPTLDEAHNQLALIYSHVGALAEALEESRVALAADPNNHLAQLRIGQTLNFQGKYEEALSALRAIPEQANPALVGHQIAWALFNLGRKDEAVATLERLLKGHAEDTGGVFTSIQAILAASEGQERVAEDKIKSAIEKGRGYGHFHHTAYHIACAYALMNKPEQAIKWLETAADDGFPCYPLFAADRNLDNLRHDGRFDALLSKTKQKWEYYQTLVQS